MNGVFDNKYYQYYWYWMVVVPPDHSQPGWTYVCLSIIRSLDSNATGTSLFINACTSITAGKKQLQELEYFDRESSFYDGHSSL